MINYVKGDASDPQVPGNRIIAHVCNDVGAWGRGFVLSLSARWPKAELSYRDWHRDRDDADLWPPMRLGQVTFVTVADGLQVANMVAQRGVGPKDDGAPPIRYGALEECLHQVGQWARDWDYASVHMPRIGCGLGGGTWAEVEPIVVRQLVCQSIDTYVYDLV